MKLRPLKRLIMKRVLMEFAINITNKITFITDQTGHSNCNTHKKYSGFKHINLISN